MKKISNPLVSIVFCSLEDEYLEKTIPSIQTLNYSNYEIICVWTGEEDQYEEIKERYSDIKVIKSEVFRSKNYGTNQGVKEAKGKYVLLLDDDVILEDKNLISKLISTTEKIPDWGLLALSTKNNGEEKLTNYGKFFSVLFTKDNPPKSMAEVKDMNRRLIGHPSGVAIFTTKKSWLKVGGYDEDYIFGGDDSDIGIRFWLYGYKNYLFSESIQLHIGMGRRADNKKYSLYYGDKLYAHLGVITKNYKMKNFIITFPLYLGMMFIKSIKQSVQRKMFGPFQGFCRGIFLYLKNFGKIMKGRYQIQSIRVVDEDIFLTIGNSNGYN